MAVAAGERRIFGEGAENNARGRVRYRGAAKSALLIAGALAGLLATAAAGPRTSAAYSVATETTDAGGKRLTSASYSVDAVTGGIVGISTAAAPAVVAKAGFAGQLYEVTGTTVTAATSTVNENATLQLAAWQILDDASYLAVSPGSVTWGVVSGPISGVSPGGLATAATVYQNTGATVQGTFGGFTGMLGLTVLNVNSDDLGTYAADGLPDDWQVQYFGADNPLAAPSLDANGNGFTNLFKYAAGLDPLDANSRFTIESPPPGGPAAPHVIEFAPVLAGRSYIVESTPSLLAPDWQPLTDFSQIDNGTIRTVTDNAIGGGLKFYRVRIVKP